MSEAPVANSGIRLRIENLSDLVFGLALSIGSIILISKLPQTPGELVTAILLFGSSFLIVVWIWSGYTRMMVILPMEVPWTFRLNLMLLFCVAIEPYLFYVMQETQVTILGFCSEVYAVDVGAMMLILAGLGYLIQREEKNRDVHRLPPIQLKRMRRVMLWQVVTGAIFFASAIPFFWIAVPIGNFLRFDLWYVTLAVFFVVSRPASTR